MQRGRHRPFGQERPVVDAQAGRLFLDVYIKARRTREGERGCPHYTGNDWRENVRSAVVFAFGAPRGLAALTLMRQGEIRTLKREHVRLEQGVVMLPKAKAGARPVILSGEAQKILKTQLERPRGMGVPEPGHRPYSRVHVSRVFRKAARAAGLKDFHFHDLRHHGATMALNAGFTAPIVMALGGLQSESMMRRYAAVTDQTLRAAAEAVSGNEIGTKRGGYPIVQPRIS